MREIATLIDTLAADYGEDIPTKVVTRVVFDLAAHRPDDDAAHIEASARAQLTEMQQDNATGG